MPAYGARRDKASSPPEIGSFGIERIDDQRPPADQRGGDEAPFQGMLQQRGADPAPTG